MNKLSTISTAWLADHLGQDNIKVLDGSFYLPAEQRDADAEYAVAHIPGAQRFNIDPVAFADAVGAKGIGNDHMVVTYDGGKLTGACRVWWMFRAFGHDKVVVLNGGFGKWQAEGRAVENTVAEPEPAKYCADFNPDMIRSMEQVLGLVEGGGAEQILDARASGRFDGSVPEPRAGMRSGHMPHALNLPYDKLLQPDGTLREAAQLRALFTEAVLLLGLRSLGHDANRLYDGSWAEWGSRDDTPIVTA